MISLNQIEQHYPENLRGFKRNILREYLQYKILEVIFNSRLALRGRLRQFWILNYKFWISAKNNYEFLILDFELRNTFKNNYEFWILDFELPLKTILDF